MIDNKSQSGSFISVFSNRLEEKTCQRGPEGQKILLATYICPGVLRIEQTMWRLVPRGDFFSHYQQPLPVWSLLSSGVRPCGTAPLQAGILAGMSLTVFFSFRQPYCRDSVYFQHHVQELCPASGILDLQPFQPFGLLCSDIPWNLRVWTTVDASAAVEPSRVASALHFYQFESL